MPSNESEYMIKIKWDPEAGVWIAVSDDAVGLALESGSLDALMERVRFALPELLELNHLPANNNIVYLLKAVGEEIDISCPEIVSDALTRKSSGNCPR